jgi:hypothetical protein
VRVANQVARRRREEGARVVNRTFSDSTPKPRTSQLAARAPLTAVAAPREQRRGRVDCRPSPITFIGRIERGFDFVGYHFSRAGLGLAEATIQKFVESAARLYEQGREHPNGSSRLGVYVRRWVGWAKGGLAAIGVDLTLLRDGARGVGGLFGLPGT